jgi:DNA end-binding protein Ku
MWKGVVSFGMVSIPIRLYVATESHGISFRQLCGEHMSPVKYKRWCAAGDHEVSFSDILKGFEIGDDRYVVIEDSDLDNLPLPTARTIEIQEFVPRDDIPAGLYYKSAYYMEPEEAGKKPYHLLMQALKETERTAVAKVAFRDREHLCALQPSDGHILLNTLNWPDEIRSVEGIRGLEGDGEVKIAPRELEMAKVLVESLSDEFDPQRYHDDYREALMKIVEAKMEGEVYQAPELAEEPKVMDLMEALRASVEAAKAQRGEDKEDREERTPARRTARKKAS